MRRLTMMTVVVAVVLPALGASSAFASSETPQPWWGVTAGSRPTDLRPGVASSEVQELTISAASGTWSIGEISPLFPHPHLIEHLLPFNAGAAEVQRALEAVESAHVVEVAGGPAVSGTGDLLGPAEGEGKLSEGSPVVEELATTSGAFAQGQTVVGAGIPAGTRIVKVEGSTLTLSAAVEAGGSASGVKLVVAASNVIEAVAMSSARAFAVHEEILGEGIPVGTTVESVDASAHTITLSQAVTETQRGDALSSALAPYTITYPDQAGVPPVKTESWSTFFPNVRCEVLEGLGDGSCGAHPERLFNALEGGAKGQPEVTVKTKGTVDGQLVVEAENLGDAAAQGEVGAGGSPIVITDTLPAGLVAVAAEGVEGGGHFNPEGEIKCEILEAGRKVKCTYEARVHPYLQIEVLISVRVEADAKTGELNSATVSGGGATRSRTATHTIEVNGSERERFGVENYSLIPENLGGSVDTQAGSHPFQVTSVITANSTYNVGPGEFGSNDVGHPRTVALVKDYIGELPAGLVGNPTPFEQCTDAEFDTRIVTHGNANEESVNECPAGSAVGVAIVHYSGIFNVPDQATTAPIFNMVPGQGEPARFAFETPFPVFLNASVRTGSDYGVTISSHNILQTDWLQSVKLTFWGVPGSKLHEHQHGWECLYELGTCTPVTATAPPPFVIMPTSCSAPFLSTLHADSWAYEEHASEVAEPFTYKLEEGGHPLKLDGCNHLPFEPSITVTPDAPDASSSTGLNVSVHVPQTAELNPEGLAESTLRNTTVTLPAGVAVNPSGADGLEACSEHLVGYEPPPVSHPPEELRFTPKLPGSFGSEGSEATLQPGVNFCPNASKIGEVSIKTPLLPNPVKGFVYLAAQNSNPFGSLVAMYAVAEDPVSGTLIKLPFDVSLNPGTGQLVATSNNSPELPFETAEFHFFGGERAPLATPSRCGAYTTTAALTPWSTEENPGTHEIEPGEIAHVSSTFDITSGPHGSACTYPGQALPFNPTLTGGATNVNAGVFSPFTATMSRKDGEQNLQSLEVHLPPGLSGVLSGVELCPEPKANLGECGPNSLIGETTVSVGVGSQPYSVSGGKFYLTGPYNGSGACTTPGVAGTGCAPFGITFEVPAKAGPFDLERNSANPAGEDACDCVIVRGKIEIDPITAAITITSNPPGTPYAIPTSIEGIPLEIQHVNAITTRNDFQFNPTNCAKMAVTGTIHSSEGGTDTISVPSQVTNCRSLAFTPKFKVSTNAHTSRAKGASLTATVSEPAGSLGTQSNLARVKVELPKQLPSRLTTLQRACTSKQFELNPAACPSESKIGYAKVLTPLVPVPLEGPAIFVSHGGEAFPSLEIVLQGYGVTIDLVGSTFISKSGITSTTFKTVPDQPFSSFALTLPTGKFSALTALGNVCTEKLSMPTEFIAQNGAEIHQTTPIGVTGCKKTKALTRAQKLKAALKACHRDKNKGKREACERVAHKRYGPVMKAKKGRK